MLFIITQNFDQLMGYRQFDNTIHYFISKNFIII